jgi:hypothetical protein
LSTDVHPTVEACVLRSFCDATFKAAMRRMEIIDRLMEHIHGNEHTGPLEGCHRCVKLLDGARPGVSAHGKAST